MDNVDRPAEPSKGRAVRFYPARWEQATRGLSAAECGSYFWLICKSVVQAGLTDADIEAELGADYASIWPRIVPMSSSRRNPFIAR